jgi:Domain of unknown function (DUF4397)
LREATRPALARLVIGLLIAVIAQTDAGLPVAAQEAMLDDEVAFIRFVHAAPAAAGLDLYVDGALVVQGLAFGSATDIYVSVAAGTHTVAATVEGDDTSVLAETSLDLAAGATDEVAVVGVTGDTFIQDYPIDASAPSDGQARIRLIDCAYDAVAVALAGGGDPDLLDGVGFPGASDGVEIWAGSYDLALRAAGAEQELTVEIGEVAFDAGAIYDLFVIGVIADGSVSLLIVSA